MNIEQPPTRSRTTSPKASAAACDRQHRRRQGQEHRRLGLALRAQGRGKAVRIYQFMKVPSARFGEHRLFEKLGVPIEGLGDGFSWKSQDLDHSRAARARRLGKRAEAIDPRGEHFLVVLDEITYPLIYGWLPMEQVLQALRERPPQVHVVLTGRGAARRADRPGRHGERDDRWSSTHYKAGVPAQRGIED